MRFSIVHKFEYHQYGLMMILVSLRGKGMSSSTRKVNLSQYFSCLCSLSVLNLHLNHLCNEKAYDSYSNSRSFLIP